MQDGTVEKAVALIAMQSSRAHQQVEREPLGQEAMHILEEARMVLPGIQALFGFQLIAVFNQRFSEIPEADQILHLAALVLTATSAALIMTPAAYHRQAERGQLSAYFIDLASRLIALAMAPLALGICLDAFVVARLILEDLATAAIVALVLLGLFSALWFVFPRLRARRICDAQSSAKPTTPTA